jgi:hypothetical protein
LVCLALLTAIRADAFVYWTDSGDYSIGRASIDGSGANDNFINDLPGVCGLAADGEFLYWGNSRLGTIGRSTLDGTGINQSLISGGLGTCGVSATGSSLGWANLGDGKSFSTSSIGIGKRNGTSVQQNWIVGPTDVNWALGTASYDDGAGINLYWPNFDGSLWSTPFEAQAPQRIVPPSPSGDFQGGIAVSDAGIFWINSVGQLLHSNLDGSGISVLVSEINGSPCGVAVDDTYLYWAEQDDGSIGRALLNGSSPDPNFIDLGEEDSPCWVAVDADTASASVAPSTVGFGGVLVGTGPTAAQDVTLSNSSETSVDLVPAVPGLLGPNADQFTISGDTCGPTVAPGDSCTISLQFSPTSLGGKFATLTISTNDPSDNPIRVPVFGTGTDPDQSVSPSSIPFGNQLMDTVSPDRTVTLTNGSGASSPDDIGQATLVGPDAGQFEIVSDGCSNTTLAIDDSCQISVRFAPTATGDGTASLSIPSDDPTSPATVALSGTGTSPDQSVSPTSLAFGSQPVGTHSATQTIDVENSADGTGPLLVGNVSLTGATSHFDIVFDTCSGRSISPGDECQVGARFTPSAAGGQSATVEIPSNGSTLPVAVSLSGTGTPAPSASPPGLNPRCKSLRAKLKKTKSKKKRKAIRKKLRKRGC